MGCSSSQEANGSFLGGFIGSVGCIIGTIICPPLAPALIPAAIASHTYGMTTLVRYDNKPPEEKIQGTTKDLIKGVANVLTLGGNLQAGVNYKCDDTRPHLHLCGKNVNPIELRIKQEDKIKRQSYEYKEIIKSDKLILDKTVKEIIKSDKLALDKTVEKIIKSCILGLDKTPTKPIIKSEISHHQKFMININTTLKLIKKSLKNDKLERHLIRETEKLIKELNKNEKERLLRRQKDSRLTTKSFDEFDKQQKIEQEIKSKIYSLKDKRLQQLPTIILSSKYEDDLAEYVKEYGYGDLRFKSQIDKSVWYFYKSWAIY